MIFPPFSQFKSWLKTYDVVPFISGPYPLPKNADPFEVFAASLSAPRAFFFDSFRALSDARHSFFPIGKPSVVWQEESGNFAASWGSLRNYFQNHRGPRIPGRFPPFYGGAAGILSYDAGRHFEKGWQTPPPPDPLKFPRLSFALYNDLIAFDHRRNSAYAVSCLNLNDRHRRAPRAAYQAMAGKAAALSKFLTKRSIKPTPRIHPTTAQPNSNRASFLASVKRIQNWIAAGDIYQANLSRRIEAPFDGDGLEFFRRLRAINPSPYACYFRFPGQEIASCSPELLVKKRGAVLETRPIAGTRPRGKNQSDDLKLEGELLLSEKERAEHIMLLDLERNDLGRICRAGSVRALKKMGVEKYSHVMHIVSHVRGQIQPGKDFFDAVEAVFPGGTITGCPKVRCMEILDQIEPAARGPFFGGAGWIGYQGDGEMNLLIRTALIKNGKATLQVGSGIVADSDPAKEFDESSHKARALLAALAK